MKRTLLAIATLVFSAAGAAANDLTGDGVADPRKAWIDISEAERLVTIEVMSNLDAGVSGTYRLEVKKAGPSGTSVNRQSGSVLAQGTSAQQSSSVSRISVEEGATLEVVLTVKDDAGHIYEDRFSKAY